MAAKRGTPDAASSIRALATDPLAPFKRESVDVPEWNDAKLVVRQMTAGDWVDYRAEIDRARRKAIKDSGITSDDLAAENEKLRVLADAAVALLEGLQDNVADDSDVAALKARLAGRVTNLQHSVESATLIPIRPNIMPATALALVRTLHSPDGQRVLTDQDVVHVAASFSDVHGRLVDKAFELSGISQSVDPVEEAGNV
ncbi:phage tail assembly chaperone [Luteimonas sp. XNQY3]|nr:phage tail assembly chaperone [Luteimonas sp. XNQY3]MCD9005231.1 phage tail assembly chaperone [Luteimonas sp. XNQY3]